MLTLDINIRVDRRPDLQGVPWQRYVYLKARNGRDAYLSTLYDKEIALEVGPALQEVWAQKLLACAYEPEFKSWLGKFCYYISRKFRLYAERYG